MPIVIVVSLTIDGLREDEFLAAMKIDALGSRKELGCRRFDVITVPSSDPAKPQYMFYEVYDDEDALAFHATQEHYKPWTAFHGSGGVLEISVVKGEGTAPDLFTPLNHLLATSPVHVTQLVREPTPAATLTALPVKLKLDDDLADMMSGNFMDNESATTDGLDFSTMDFGLGT